MIVALALSAVLAGGATAAALPRDGENCGGNTIELNSCLSAIAQEVDHEHQRYVAAARTRLKHDAATDPNDAGVAKAVKGFEKAEAAWLAYRESECGAVYDNWSAGTIRGSMYAICRIHLTRLRTYTVWLNWLTYEDSTEPVLPEPPVPPVR